MGSERKQCCEKHERGRRCGDCPHDDRLVDHLGGNPALREELMGRLTSLRARVARLEAALTVESLAQALCDSSSHMNTLPHAEQRPCHYHRNRAADTLKQLARAAAIRRRGA